MPKFQLWMMVLASVAVPGLGELFSSMAHLQTALYAERDIAIEIRKYIIKEQERLTKLTKIADDFEQHSLQALENPDEHLGNPVDAYLFVKHFTLDWDRDIETTLKNNSRDELTDRVEELRRYLPTYEDLSGSVNALLRLQDTYKLETADIAQGIVGGAKSSELSAEDCFELGRLAYNDEDYYHTIMWMEEALTKNSQTQNESIDALEILDYLAFSAYKQGNIKRALSLTDELLTLEPGHSRARSNKAYYERILRETEKDSHKRGEEGEVVVNKRVLDNYRQGEEFTLYEALCRNETLKKNKNEHKLVCRYRTNNDPILMLAPAKEEELHLDPFLAVYHNSLSDGEINLIKTLAMPKLGRATVHNPKTGRLETAEYRVSKSCWLSEEDDEGIQRINNRIEAITGFTLETAEELQVANYGIGGQYEPHFDFARNRENAFEGGVGNRIATFMYYMSDVQAGGATVFPYLGLKIFPEKGKAVFWYNLFRSGEGIYDTRHAACPVLVGSKWVSNKWIHERGQEFRRPCALSETE